MFTQLQHAGTSDDMFDQLVQAVSHELAAPQGAARGHMPAVGDAELRRLVSAARDGDPKALESVVALVQDDVYRLALRMLWHPKEARDATQESAHPHRHPPCVLPRRGCLPDLGVPRGRQLHPQLPQESRRTGEPHLPPLRRGSSGRSRPPDPSLPDAGLLAEEVKLGCTLGMLLCLDRHERLAYVLSDVFELPSTEAGFICDTTPDAFRKRASRARVKLREFVAAHCGLVSRDAACRCDRRVEAAVRLGRVRPHALQFARRSDVEAGVVEMERLQDLASLMKSHPGYSAPESVTAAVRHLIDSGDYRLLE